MLTLAINRKGVKRKILYAAVYNLLPAHRGTAERVSHAHLRHVVRRPLPPYLFPNFVSANNHFIANILISKSLALTIKKIFFFFSFTPF